MWEVAQELSVMSDTGKKEKRYCQGLENMAADFMNNKKLAFLWHTSVKNAHLRYYLSYEDEWNFNAFCCYSVNIMRIYPENKAEFYNSAPRFTNPIMYKVVQAWYFNGCIGNHHHVVILCCRSCCHYDFTSCILCLTFWTQKASEMIYKNVGSAHLVAHSSLGERLIYCKS